MRIREVLRRKGGAVATLAPQTPISDLVELLTEQGIGSVVVSEDGHGVAGIVSERDVVRGLQHLGPDMLSQPVSSIMTADVHTCTPQDELETLARTMTDYRIRHLPVLVDGRLAGIVSIGDIVKNRIDELQTERDHLVGYIQQ